MYKILFFTSSTLLKLILKKAHLYVVYFAAFSFSALAAETVTTSDGTLSGIVDPETSLLSFKGVPFAKPPTGQLRWRPPQPPKSWQGVKDATHFGNQCMQNPLFDDMLFRSKGVSEDCLYLNVWTPDVKPEHPMPVLLYFYGGGFAAGDGSEPRYDGASMARQGVVVITANYRLGLFGLFAHPQLSKEAKHKGSGNYTFMDQAAALKWAVKHINHFGGDPERITIGGESAGSLSVSALMASPLSRHYIAGAIGESGSLLGPTLSAIDLKSAEKVGIKISTALAKDDPLSLAELREIPAQELLDKATSAGFNWFSPTVDGYVFPKDPEQIYMDNEHAKVPLLAGINSQEASHDQILGNQEPTVANYHLALKKLYPEDHGKVFSLYPATSQEQVLNAAQALAGDRFLGFSTWNWIHMATQKNGQSGYYYLFNHKRPPSVGSSADSTAHIRGAIHSAEIEYALGNLSIHPVYQWQKNDFLVSELMQQYFANFIKTGNPNGSGLVHWPQFSEHKQLILNSNPKSEDTQYLRNRYQFHKQYYATQQ